MQNVKSPFQKVSFVVAGWQSAIFHPSAVWTTGHHTAVQLSSFYCAQGFDCKSWNFGELFPISLDVWATRWTKYQERHSLLALHLHQKQFSKTWQRPLLAVSAMQLFLCAACWPPKKLRGSFKFNGTNRQFIFLFFFARESFLLGFTVEAAFFSFSFFFLRPWHFGGSASS